jgi:acyl-CoA synthetase (AMP-forming)/AMP-acid ligase II
VVPKNDREVSEKELIAHCKKELASFNAPKKVLFIAELPKSPAGKILRRKIKLDFQ